MTINRVTKIETPLNEFCGFKWHKSCNSFKSSYLPCHCRLSISIMNPRLQSLACLNAKKLPRIKAVLFDANNWPIKVYQSLSNFIFFHSSCCYAHSKGQSPLIGTFWSKFSTLNMDFAFVWSQIVNQMETVI